MMTQLPECAERLCNHLRMLGVVYADILVAMSRTTQGEALGRNTDKWVDKISASFRLIPQNVDASRIAFRHLKDEAPNAGALSVLLEAALAPAAVLYELVVDSCESAKHRAEIKALQQRYGFSSERFEVITCRVTALGATKIVGLIEAIELGFGRKSSFDSEFAKTLTNIVCGLDNHAAFVAPDFMVRRKTAIAIVDKWFDRMRKEHPGFSAVEVRLLQNLKTRPVHDALASLEPEAWPELIETIFQGLCRARN